jgi:hypothetical protein
MKTIFQTILSLIFVITITSANAQTINWAGINDQHKHILNANVGLEHGTIFGFGYSYRVDTKLFPIVTNAEFSLPAGNNIKDDFKTKVGAQIRVIEYRNFQFTAKLQGVFRRHQQELVRVINFGSDISGVAGYYRPKWFVAGEVGFDKAIATQFKHSNLYREIHPGAINGWYDPATGGNFYYGLQTGFSFNRHDITLRAGKMLTQDFKTKPFVPYYAQLGYNFKF